MAEIKIEDHSAEVLSSLKEQAQRALESCGLVAEGYAKLLVPVDTGALRNSISHKVSDNECYIGTNMEYAPYIEFGTGKDSVMGGRQTPWVYQAADGVLQDVFRRRACAADVGGLHGNGHAGR